MARQRTTGTELARLLNSARRPVYVLDDEQTLVFCNRACLEWVGRTAEELLGRRCAYHSSPDVTGADTVAAGLCPPPEAMAGQSITGTVWSVGDDGGVRRRRARFSPLGEGPQDLIALLAVVEPNDLPEPETPTLAETPPPAADETEAAMLHERIRWFRQQAAGRVRADRLLGEGPAIRRARAQVELAAGTQASVLLVGPPGSGRRHTAGAIHYARGADSSGSLIPLACSSLGADLIHSTLTALVAKNPLGEQAGRSTLLLNDAEQLPLEVQAELAALLAGRSFPLRLIATAEEPLEQLARRGEYREDLALLLSTIVIGLPPLAGRRADLPLLAQLFLEELNVRSEKQVGGFSPEAMDRLDAYGWPGNLDELALVVAEAHRDAEGPLIGAVDLPQRIHLAAEASTHPRRQEETIVLDELLGNIEEELIHRALARAKGNKTKAARLLGMTRPRLYRRLVQLGLERESGGGQ